MGCNTKDYKLPEPSYNGCKYIPKQVKAIGHDNNGNVYNVLLNDEKIFVGTMTKRQMKKFSTKGILEYKSVLCGAKEKNTKFVNAIQLQ